MDDISLAVGADGLLTSNLTYLIGGAIVLIGLVFYGFADLVRFSPGRVWALSGVAFDESIRRRVLWIIPLAILGIIVVGQFQKAPGGPQDAVRQTIKACIFATGVVVMVTSLILACSSLPKEIDSRVIYTIVTKPATRLEIVLGKIVGFARVSGTILLIMGLFTFGYLKLREAQLLSVARAQLQTEAIDPVSRQLYQHYTEAGLLATKSMEVADAMQVMAHPPAADKLERRMAGGQSQYYVVAFDLSTDEKALIAQTVSNGGGLIVSSTLPYEQREPTEEEAREIADLRLPLMDGEPSPREGPAPEDPASDEQQRRLPIPQLQIQVLDRNRVRLVNPDHIGSLEWLMSRVPDESGEVKPPTVSPNINLDRKGNAMAYIAPEGVDAILGAGQVYVTVTGVTPAVEYLVGVTPTVLVLVNSQGQQVAMFKPAARRALAQDEDEIWAQPVEGDPAAPLLLSTQGRFGMQLMGDDQGKGPVAVYSFNEADAPAVSDGKATLELRIGIEGSTMDFTAEGENVAQMSLQVRNHKSGVTSEPITFIPENDRTSYVRVPAELLSDGTFDVYVRGLTEGQWFGIQPTSVAVVTADRSFLFNLFKSLLTLWLMAILVIAISVFCSTWLSWPIAVVLTLVILLGRWGVEQVGGAGVGMGTEVTRSMGIDNPDAATVVRTTVNFLTTTVEVMAAFLPDISRFSVTEDIEQGISIPLAKIAQGGWVLLTYGVPITVLAYVFLRRKEVAP